MKVDGSGFSSSVPGSFPSVLSKISLRLCSSSSCFLNLEEDSRTRIKSMAVKKGMSGVL